MTQHKYIIGDKLDRLEKEIQMLDSIECKLTRAQKALLDWGVKHPHSRIKDLEFVDGQPMKIVVVTEDGLGTELVRFDKIVNGKENKYVET